MREGFAIMNGIVNLPQPVIARLPNSPSQSRSQPALTARPAYDSTTTRV